jgi:Raf kinase inhibitor-like YbhB/YbcL family protein
MRMDERCIPMDILVVKIPVLKLPPDYTCDGEDRSPAIQVEGVGPRVRSMVVMVIDATVNSGGSFTHWLFWNVEPARLVPENVPKEPLVQFPIAGVQGKNDFGSIGYSGPCPPKGSEHRYDIKVYGMDTLIALPPGSDRKALAGAMGGHVIAFGQTSVSYGR